MARLVVNPGSAAAWEIALRPGENSLGRGPGNDFQIPHPSVSSAHCRIVLNADLVLLQDLGSTNGTFVNRTPVQEAPLQTGQLVRIGEVEMVFYSDGPAPEVAYSVVPGDATVGQSAPLRTTTVTAQTDSPSAPALVGPKSCKFHPKMAARLLCPKCQAYYCEACVAVRHAGAKFCRHCGTPCTPVQAQFEPLADKNFFERAPGAFAYPLRGGGVIVVIVGIVMFALLKWGAACIQFRTVRLVIFGIILEIFAGGYLFTYLQSIIHSTAAEERELPDLPGISNFAEDVLVPFFRLLGLLVVCFGPAIGLTVWAIADHTASATLAAWAALALGCLYFPMAFLSVAIHDSAAAANPLLVIPSILKVPLYYLLVLVAITVVLGVQYGGWRLIDKFLPEGITTQSMSQLVGLLASGGLLSFASLYLLVVAVHLLALLYVTQKERLAWLRR